MRIHITRHGQVLPMDIATDEDVDFPRGDPPISELGRKQAVLLGRKLKSLEFEGRIFSSPYRRATETAHIIASILDIKIWLCPEIRELVKSKEKLDAFNGGSIEHLAEEFYTVDDEQGLPYPWWSHRGETIERYINKSKTLYGKSYIRGDGCTYGWAWCQCRSIDKNHTVKIRTG